MRVLLVANTLPPTDISGVGEQVLQLAAGLRAAGHEVQILGRGPDGARGPKVLFPLAVVPPFWRLLRRFRPHVVQVHESDGALAALVLKVISPLLRPPALLAALLQVSYIEEMRAVRPLREANRLLAAPGSKEILFRYLKGPLQVAMGCLTAWLADLLMAPSQATAREIERDYGVDRPRVLPNVTGGVAVDIEPTTAGDESGDYLLFVGRLRIRKGVEVLLEALRRLDGEDSQARLLIAGDGEHRAALESAMRRLELQDRVRFLGRCDGGRVRRLLRDGARALVVPSIYEGMPLVILEAMEAGVPVVASAVSGIPEVVEDGRTGWLVPPEDPQALAHALRHAWRDPAEARRRGGAGQRKLEQAHRPQVAARVWQQIVRSHPMGSRTGEEAGSMEQRSETGREGQRHDG